MDSPVTGSVIILKNKKLLVFLVILVAVVLIGSTFLFRRAGQDAGHYIWIYVVNEDGSYKQSRQLNLTPEDHQLLPTEKYIVAIKPEMVNAINIPIYDVFILEPLDTKDRSLVTVAFDENNNAVLLSGDNLNISQYVLRFNRLIGRTSFKLNYDDVDLTDSYLDLHLQSLFRDKYPVARGGEIFMNPEKRSLTAQLNSVSRSITFKNSKAFNQYKDIFVDKSRHVESQKVHYNLILDRSKSSGELEYLKFVADRNGKIEIKTENIDIEGKKEEPVENP